jgi:hypothetical protein
VSNELRNTLHGFSVWFDGGGWLVLLILAIVIALIAVALVVRR